MPQVISSARGIAAALSQTVDQTFVFLLEINYGEEQQNLRFAANYTDITHNGEVYIAKPFRFTMPTDSATRPPQARLVIEDINRVLAAQFRPTEKPPELTLTFIRVEEPDVVEGVVRDLLLKNMSISVEGVLSCDVVWDSLVAEPYPIHRYDPALFPGLFR